MADRRQQHRVEAAALRCSRGLGEFGGVCPHRDMPPLVANKFVTSDPIVAYRTFCGMLHGSTSNDPKLAVNRTLPVPWRPDWTSSAAGNRRSCYSAAHRTRPAQNPRPKPGEGRSPAARQRSTHSLQPGPFPSPLCGRPAQVPPLRRWSRLAFSVDGNDAAHLGEARP